MTRTVLCGDRSKCQAQPGQGHRSQCPRPHHERRIPFRRLARIVTYFSMFCAGARAERTNHSNIANDYFYFRFVEIVKGLLQRRGRRFFEWLCNPNFPRPQSRLSQEAQFRGAGLARARQASVRGTLGSDQGYLDSRFFQGRQVTLGNAAVGNQIMNARWRCDRR